MAESLDLKADRLLLIPPPEVECVICHEKPNGPNSLWICQWCEHFVCSHHTLCLPTASNLKPHYPKKRADPNEKGQRDEYFAMTLCSIACWEKAGCPDE